MKTYQVRATGMEFLRQLEIEADSEQQAEDIYRKKWENGEIPAEGYDLEVTVEEGD